MEPKRISYYYLVGILAAMAILLILSHASCDYLAIFNVGDSTFDMCVIHFVFPFNEFRQIPPYGKNLFGQPTGRYNDEKLSVDFSGTLNNSSYG